MVSKISFSFVALALSIFLAQSVISTPIPVSTVKSDILSYIKSLTLYFLLSYKPIGS